MRTQELFHFIKERHAIHQRRQAGVLKPWTKDPILRAYRFCNVYRELDTVTQWIRTNWREPNRDDPDVWFAMVIARLVNTPETLQEIAYPKNFRSRWFVDTLHAQREQGKKVFSGAYIVSTNGHAQDKAEYLAEHVLLPLWQNKKEVRPRKGESLASFHARLMQFDGMGSFMAAQVIADTKYTQSLNLAPDWWSWAASGPGSRRGFNHVMGRAIDAPWREAEWQEHLAELKILVDKYVERLHYPMLHAQDLQNCLCETSKYVRGYSRTRYPGLP